MQISLCDVKHLRAINTAIIIHLLDEETIGEGWDVQHVEERGLAGTNLVANLDKSDITLKRENLVGYRHKGINTPLVKHI